MVSTTAPPATMLRVSFSGGAALDEAILKARPMSRVFLLRRLAEEGLRLRQQSNVAPLDPSDWGRSPGVAQTCVRFPIGDDGELSRYLRSLPGDGRAGALLRTATLRELAAAGLAAQSRLLLIGRE